MTTIYEFIVKIKITMTYSKIQKRTDGIYWKGMENHWKFTIKHDNKQISGQFSGGSAITDIDCADVLNSLVIDATFYDYEPEDNKRLVKICKRTKEKLINLLGGDKFNELCYDVEPL